MPKQYTFKTTRATEWMEHHLDNLPPSERSRFIRSCIADRLNGKTVTQSTSDIVTQKVIKEDYVTPESINLFEESKPVEVDLDGALDELYG